MKSGRELKRCAWSKDGLMREYHDREWGVPLHDDGMLFEFLVLEGAQAGLSWSTILNRRENYRRAFSNFDVKKVSRFDAGKKAALLKNKGIIRNGLKVSSAISNARAFIGVQKEFGSFDRYVWRFVNFKPIKNRFKSASEIPCVTRESEELSDDLKKRGFSFVGPKIVYAHMQATGMVNDHVVSCFRHGEV